MSKRICVFSLTILLVILACKIIFAQEFMLTDDSIKSTLKILNYLIVDDESGFNELNDIQKDSFIVMIKKLNKIYMAKEIGGFEGEAFYNLMLEEGDGVPSVTRLEVENYLKREKEIAPVLRKMDNKLRNRK